MKRIILHTLHVKRKGMKLLFSINLPDSVTRITGIRITTRPVEGGSPEYDQVSGSIWLRAGEQRNLLYTDYVEVEKPEEDQTIDGRVGTQTLGTQQRWINPPSKEFFSLDLATTNPVVEGFYEDKAVYAIGEYKINIYLKISA